VANKRLNPCSRLPPGAHGVVPRYDQRDGRRLRCSSRARRSLGDGAAGRSLFHTHSHITSTSLHLISDLLAPLTVSHSMIHLCCLITLTPPSHLHFTSFLTYWRCRLLTLSHSMIHLCCLITLTPPSHLHFTSFLTYGAPTAGFPSLQHAQQQPHRPQSILTRLPAHSAHACRQRHKSRVRWAGDGRGVHFVSSPVYTPAIVQCEQKMSRKSTLAVKIREKVLH
jgi:hypothetical protein